MREILLQATDRGDSTVISASNAGEVYCQLLRHQGSDAAESFWVDAASGNVPFRLYSATDARVRRAAALKARHRLAYADAFAVALAQEMRAPLVTGDPEIRVVAEEAGIELHWLGP